MNCLFHSLVHLLIGYLDAILKILDCVHAYVFMCMPMFVCESVDVSPSLQLYLRHGLLFTAAYIRLDNLWVSRDSPVFASHLIVGAPRSQLHTTKTFFFCEFWVKSGPHPCSASMLHTEPFPQPWQFLVFNFWSSFIYPVYYIVGKESFPIFMSSFFALVIVYFGVQKLCFKFMQTHLSNIGIFSCTTEILYRNSLHISGSVLF